MTNEQAIKEFDKKFEGYWRGQAIPDELKFFIRQKIQNAYWLGVQVMGEEMKGDITYARRRF